MKIYPSLVNSCSWELGEIRGEHVARVCWSVISHLNTVARSGASKRNLAPARGAQINRRLLPSDTDSFQTVRGWRLHGTMATFRADSGLPPAFNENDGTQQPRGLWRPWADKEESPSGGGRVSLGNVSTLMSAFSLDKSNKIFLTCISQTQSFHGEQTFTKHPKMLRFVHPVRWVGAAVWKRAPLVRNPGSPFNADLSSPGCSGPKPDALTTCTGTRRCCCATIPSKRPSACTKTPAVTKTATKRKRTRKKSWINVWSLAA